jgi:hypothetical protein
MFKIKRDIKEISNRNQAFVERKEVDRPLYGAFILGNEYMKEYKETYKNIPHDREVKPQDIITEDFLKDIGGIIESSKETGGDLFYPAVPYFFIPWMEAIIGCHIFAGRDSFYAKPFIDSLDNVNGKIDLSSDNKWLAKLIEMETALLNYLDGSYPIGSSTHLRGPIDMVSAAIGQSRFCLELYDNPEKIKELSSSYTETFINVAKIENEIASKSRFKGYVVNNYGVWTPYVCQYYQDDALAFISPQIYKDFFQKEHARIDGSFKSSLFHVHPISLFIVDELLKLPNLDIIEINREPMGPSVEELLPTFKKIQENNKSLIINFTTVNFDLELLEREVSLAVNSLSKRGLCIYVSVKDKDDGIKKMDLVKRIISAS